MSTEQLLVNELFPTLQGEGPNTGRPSFFIRLHGCNLDCAWCDTSFTWDGSENGYSISVEDLVRKIEDSNCHSVVITGGEPLLQQRKPAFKSLISHLKDYRIEIETNGTVIPSIDAKFITYNVSPKLPHSGVKHVWSHRMLESWDVVQDPVNWKFVVRCDNIDVCKQDLNNIAMHTDDRVLYNLFLMPEGVTIESQISGLHVLWETLKDYHSKAFSYARISTRSHILAHGKKRRV